MLDELTLVLRVHLAEHFAPGATQRLLLLFTAHLLELLSSEACNILWSLLVQDVCLFGNSDGSLLRISSDHDHVHAS